MFSMTRRRRVAKKFRSTPSLSLASFNETDGVTHDESALAFVICHYCSYTPLRIPDGGMCPKCGSHSWESLRHPIRITVREDGPEF